MFSVMIISKCFVFGILIGNTIGCTIVPIETYCVFLCQLKCSLLIGILFEQQCFILCWFMATWIRWIIRDNLISHYDTFRCYNFALTVSIYFLKHIYIQHQITIKKTILIITSIFITDFLLPYFYLKRSQDKRIRV